ncbi:2OG-Fe(II) oxygenase [Thalassotalea euphylliae]|uniref:2OG-Fe(II) oxygenase n=1 Tax=Thalassotalea euphylliae TaxID=1655234 RepID=UPI00364332E1
MHHFIAEFKHAFAPDFCQQLISKFETDPHKTQGRIGSGVDTTKKNSIDIHLSTLSDWQQEHQQIQQTIQQALIQYIKAYPHMLVGAISPAIADPVTGQATPLTPEHIQAMPEQQLSNIISSVFELDAINMQKYEASKGNFNHWHSEHYPHPTDTSQKSLRRVLLWLVYLNDIDQGGETEFLYQQARIKPATGSLVLSPCGFTHTHRGVTPIEKDKYVLASWVMFKPAQQLYGSN